MPRRKFSQLDLTAWTAARERDALDPARRAAHTRARNRVTAAQNAVLTNTIAFFDAARPTAVRMGLWSELWFPPPGDPAATERARMSARSMRDRAGRGRSSIKEYAFLTATADWLDGYAAALKQSRELNWSPQQVQDTFAGLRSRWDRNTSGRARDRAAHRELF